MPLKRWCIVLGRWCLLTLFPIWLESSIFKYLNYIICITVLSIHLKVFNSLLRWIFSWKNIQKYAPTVFWKYCLNDVTWLKLFYPDSRPKWLPRIRFYYYFLFGLWVMYFLNENYWCHSHKVWIMVVWGSVPIYTYCVMNKSPEQRDERVHTSNPNIYL